MPYLDTSNYQCLLKTQSILLLNGVTFVQSRTRKETLSTSTPCAIGNIFSINVMLDHTAGDNIAVIRLTEQQKALQLCKI